MIVGHWAFAAIAKRTFFSAENYALLIFAAYGPDFVDKTMSVLFGLPGRNVGHSLVVFVALLGLGWAAAWFLGLKKGFVTAAAVMWASHLLGDFVRPEVLFWPMYGPVQGMPFDFPAVLYRMYVEIRWPHQLALEIILLVTLAGLVFFPAAMRSSGERALALARSITGNRSVRS